MLGQNEGIFAHCPTSFTSGLAPDGTERDTHSMASLDAYTPQEGGMPGRTRGIRSMTLGLRLGLTQLVLRTSTLTRGETLPIYICL